MCIVRICIQCDADVRVTHNILKGFGVQATLCHVGTKSMAAYMRRDLRKLNFVYAIILLADMIEVFLPVQRNHGHIILIQSPTVSKPLLPTLCAFSRLLLSTYTSEH